MKLKKAIFLLFLLSIVCSLQSQNNSLRNYALRDGLPQSQVYAMLQDSTGYLWLGTQGGGLARFDGAEFKVWDTNDGLLSNYIYALASKKDTLFIGTRNGLSVKTKSGFLNTKAPQVNSLFNHKSELFLGTDLGIFKFQKNGTLKKLILQSGIDNDVVNDIIFDGTHFWIAAKNGLWRLKSLQKNNNIEKYAIGNFRSLALKDDNLLAATFNKGIFSIAIKKIENSRIISDGNRINNISIFEDQLWISTDDSGIQILDTNSWQPVKTLNISDGLSVSHIRKVIKDRNNNIWIATSGGGFYKYFQNDFTHFDQDTGLEGNRIYAVHAYKDEIWISNSEAGMTKIDSTGIHPIPKISGFENVKIKTITSDAKGNLWAGSDGKGMLYRENLTRDSIVSNYILNSLISTDTLKITENRNHLLNPETGFPSNWIRSIITRNNTIWAATYADGIFKFTYDTQSSQIKILNSFGKVAGIEDLLIRTLVEDRNGKFWYGTQKGHLGYVFENKVTDFGTVLESETAINSIVFRDSTLFVGTAGNGIWWTTTPEKPRFKKLNGEKEAHSNNSYQLIFDDEGNLWTGTEKGIEKLVLNKDNKIVDVFHFGHNDGFLGQETCLNAVDKDSNGNLWFGALYGLTKYSPTKILNKATVKPKLHIESFEIGYKTIDSINVDKWATSKRILQLSPEQTQIGFRYKTIDLDHPNDIQYRVKLDETEWSPWSSDNSQNLAGLAYGTHTFTAQSRNYRWENSEPVSVLFYIEYPLYQKPWFQWLIGGVLALLVLVGIWIYINRLKRKNQKEREQLKLKNHLLELEQKALRLQMNPHFIFNVLNGMKGMRTSNPEKMDTTINIFAKLLREILHNSRKDTINLQQEIETIEKYIKVEKLMAEKNFEYSIETNLEIPAEEILIPPMLVQPFVENAIRHGILKTAEEGFLKINFETSEDFLHCKITDNGPGIFNSQQNKTKTDHQSMALIVTRERIESLGGNNTLTTKETKINETISGTEIYFKIPLITEF